MVVSKLLILAILVVICEASRIKYVITEHPEVTWYNPKYARYVNMTSRRYSRADPFYYVGFHVDSIWPVNNNVSIDFYFYEFLSNQYKRSFVEIHLDLCHMISKEIFFGISFAKFVPHPCPLEAGIYHMENVTIPLKHIPEHVPFLKGRVKANFTSKDTHELLGYGHMDMDIREINTRRLKNRN